jgi:geranylgeranyl diphosphate synthase, type I
MRAGAGREQVDLLDRAARDLGLAFQFVDDLLGVRGDPRVTGKPVGNDLRQRKKSLPVVAALASGTAEGRELAGVYAGDGELGPEEVHRATELVELSGALDWCREQVDLLLAAALRRIRLLPGPVDDLVALAHLIAHRDH